MGYKWVTKNHRLTINKALFPALRQSKTHISSKIEAFFSSVPMAQRLMCRYLAAEKWGLLHLISIVEIEAHGPPRPYYRAPRLGPRPFSISLVNSFGGNFVWMPVPWIDHPAPRHLCPEQVDSILSTVRQQDHGPSARWLRCTLVQAQLPGSFASDSMPCRHHRRTGRVEHGWYRQQHGNGFELSQKSPWMREL